MAFYANRLIRNRLLVVYTLVRNPSVQQYSANNITLLNEEEKVERVFALEHTIRGIREEDEKKDKLPVENIPFDDSWTKLEAKDSEILLVPQTEGFGERSVWSSLLEKVK